MSDEAGPAGGTGPAWTAAVALIAGGGVLALTALAAMHVLFPNVVGPRWWLAIVAIPAGLAGLAMGLAGAAVWRHRHRPVRCLAWGRAGLWLAVAAVLPAVLVAVRWVIRAVESGGDPLAGAWDVCWPVLLPLVPLPAVAAVGVALPFLRRRGASAAAAAPPSATATRTAWGAAIVLLAPAALGLFTPLRFERLQISGRFMGTGSLTGDDLLDALARDRCLGGRLYQRWYWEIERGYWSGWELLPDAVQGETDLRYPEQWEIVSALHDRQAAPAVTAALLEAMADPAYNVDARMTLLGYLNDREDLRPQALPVVLQILRDPASTRGAFWEHGQMAPKPRAQIMEQYRHYLRDEAIDILLAWRVPPAAAEPALRIAFADEGYRAQTAWTLTSLLAELALESG